MRIHTASAPFSRSAFTMAAATSMRGSSYSWHTRQPVPALPSGGAASRERRQAREARGLRGHVGLPCTAASSVMPGSSVVFSEDSGFPFRSASTCACHASLETGAKAFGMGVGSSAMGRAFL
jgi:hypothetical protein